MKKKFRGSWILFFLFAVSILASTFQKEAYALTEQGDTITFSYNASTVYQEVAVDTIGKNKITASVRAAQVESGIDQVYVGIELYGDGGGGIYFHDTSWVPLSSGGYTDINLAVNSASVGPGWDQVKTARIVIGGDDGEFWAGNYGPSIESASLKLDGTELLTNVDFSSGTQGWTSSVGWQICSGGWGYQPCSSVESRLNNSAYSVGTDMVWGTADEGWNLSITAPGGRNFYSSSIC